MTENITFGDERRVRELFYRERFLRFRDTDRIFAVLMVVQWLGGIIMALIVSPRTWIGDTPHAHLHVWAAFILGSAISSVPVYLAIFYPGRWQTRHAIAFAQIAWSGLLIHLSGGRIETHFHVFGSLAFLAIYRDWKVLITASLVATMDHFIRGYWWPQSVFGVFVENPYRWIEHAAWVVFEDIFLIHSCLQGAKETREICRRQASLEATNAHIEFKVEERTRQLVELNQHVDDANQELKVQAEQLSLSNALLAEEIAERTKADGARAKLHVQLLASSRLAGMAEVATGVLHNVGNVLNSVNVSASIIADRLQRSRVTSFTKAAEIFGQHRNDLPSFLVDDARGRHFPNLLDELARNLTDERELQLEEVAELIKNIDHVKDIVNMQQAFAHLRGITEPVDVAASVGDALKIIEAGLAHQNIKVKCEFGDVPLIPTDRNKVLQILVNLIGNAKHAVGENQNDNQQVMLTTSADKENMQIEVRDNGVGIPRENLNKIFAHGFTTKRNGHGFGLHSSALAAQELGGSISVKSDGLGRGATFTLRLPLESKMQCTT